MTLDHLRVVLVRTTHPGNIGAAARAMANMGLRHLYLVEPQAFPSPDATARAAGADEILENVTHCETLDAAVSDCGLVVGATARPRSVGWPLSSPEEAMVQVCNRIDTENVAFVFGQEASGLTNIELERCQLHVRIPVDERFPSVNLAAAVLIMAYEVRKSGHPGKGQDLAAAGDDRLATASEVQGFYRHLEVVLNEIGFLKNPSQKLLRKVKRIFSRTPLLEDEVNILRGILKSVQAYGNQDGRR